MKLIHFTYSKSNGEVSERDILVLNEPVKFVSGLDVTDTLNISEFAHEYNLLVAEHMAKVEELKALYGVTKFRQFKPELMSNVETTYLA